MKITRTFAMAILSLFVLQVHAQTEPPKGFQKGSIMLTDGATLTGFIKDNMGKNATITFLAADEKKKNYDGSALSGAEINGVKFICVRGDFFKVLCEGDLCYLQKSSDASGKPIYNGTEASFSSGTEGKQGDYFIYNNISRELTWVSKKNINEVAKASFAGYAAAIDKAKTVNGNLAQLKDAVEMYNNRNK